MTFRLMFGAACAVVGAAALAVAQEAPQPPADAKEEKPKWDVAAPPLPTRTVNINVDEGTWMDVDVSPDGRTIAFDMLGDIYTMPITGGTATRIAEGLPYEMQPQFSPDGKRIAFTSDRGGGDNIWLMNVDGSDKRQLTKEEFRLLNQPSLEPGWAFHRSAQALHHRALARHRRDLDLSCRRRRWLCRGQEAPARRCRRNWASRCMRRMARQHLLHAQRLAGADLRVCAGFERQPVRDREVRVRDGQGEHGRATALAARHDLRHRRTERSWRSCGASGTCRSSM